VSLIVSLGNAREHWGGEEGVRKKLFYIRQDTVELAGGRGYQEVLGYLELLLVGHFFLKMVGLLVGECVC